MSSPILISIIVAMSDNRCIGRKNDLPWHIPDDLKRTRDITMGKALIMGRKTYDSIAARRKGKPLPGRDSIVISRHMDKPDFETVHVTSSFEEALKLGYDITKEKGKNELMIFGGAQIYERALSATNRIYLTKVHMTIEDGDAFFPEIDTEIWRETDTEHHTTDDGLSYTYSTLEKI